MDLAERLDRYIASKSRKPDPFASDTDAMRDQLTSGGMSEDQAFNLALAMARERERARDVPEENILGGDMSRLFQQDPTMMERIKRLPAQTLGAGEALASLGSAAALSVPSMVQSLVTGEKDPLGMMKRQMYVPKTEEGMGALTAVGELLPEIPAMPQVQLQALQAIPAGAAAAQAQRGVQGGLRAAQPMLAEGAERILGAQGLMMQAAPSAVARMEAPTSPLGFYDPVHQAALNIQRKQGPGQAFLNELQRSENVNKEFLESSGIAEKLRNSPSITREQVQELAKGAVPEIQEVVKGSKEIEAAKRAEANLNKSWRTLEDSLPDMSMLKFYNLRDMWADAAVRGDQAALENIRALNLPKDVEDAVFAYGKAKIEYADTKQLSRENPPRYAQYQLPGGENYREVLLKMPSSKSETTNDIAKRLFNKEMRFLSENEKDQVVQESRRLFETQPKEFRSPHWEEPNVVAHIRMNDRTDADGKKVLFIEEIQSDWAQEGRKKGFVDKSVSMSELTRQYDALNAERRRVEKVIAEGDDADSKTQEAVNRASEINRQMNLLSDRMTELRSGIPSAPFVTNTKEWLDLSLKNIIKRAVDEGYDRVAFVNGTQSADRYNLSKQIESVSWQLDRSNPNDHRIIISAEQKDDQGPVDFGSRTNSFKPDELSSVVGKELADKILESINNNKKWGILEGLDLEVGGEGMKAFYDKLVPERVHAVLKRFGGGNIGVVKLPGIRETAVPMNALQPGFDITPAMRERFQKPIPYKKGGLVQAFQAGGIVKGAVAGAKAGAKGAKQASDAAIRVSKKLEEISEKPVATPAELDKAIQQSSKRIAKDNPKLSEQEVEKKAERDVLSRFRWERIDKPSAVSEFGELVNEPYSAPLARRFRNVPSVVEERAQRAEEFLRQPTEPWTPPPPGLQAFDRSLIKEALEGFPGVEQTRFPRYQPARADVGYVGEMYDNPRNRELIKKQIMRGLPLGGETFYGSLYPLKMAALERGIPAEKFEQFVYETAPASARNSIMNEMAVGQFLRDMNARGLPLDEKTVAEEMAKFKQKYGIGLPLMPVHRQGVQQVIEGNTNLREQVKADIPTNYKIPTYGTQKAGDFGKSVVLDVHEAAGETLASPYHPYFTRQGGFGSTEYGLAESKMLDIANELGIPGGMAQAGRWFGGGELTGLKSPRGDALDLLEKQTAYTLQGQGVKPTPKNIRNYILDMVETGEGVLMPYFKSEAMPDVRTKKKKGGLVQAFQSGGKVISLAAKAAKAAKEAKVAKPVAKEAVPVLSTVDFADKNWRSAIDDVVKYMNNVGVPYAPWQFMRDKPDVPLGRIMDEIERDVYFVRSNPILPEGQVNLLEELFKKAREAEASYTRSGTPRDPMTGEPTMASGGLAVLRKKHGN